MLLWFFLNSLLYIREKCSRGDFWAVGVAHWAGSLTLIPEDLARNTLTKTSFRVPLNPHQLQDYWPVADSDPWPPCRGEEVNQKISQLLSMIHYLLFPWLQGWDSSTGQTDSARSRSTQNYVRILCMWGISIPKKKGWSYSGRLNWHTLVFIPKIIMTEKCREIIMKSISGCNPLTLVLKSLL